MHAETKRLLKQAEEVGRQALAEVERLEAERQALSDEINELRGMARRFGLLQVGSPTKGKQRKSRGKYASAQLVQRARETILASWPTEFFTTNQLAPRLGVNPVSARAAITQLVDAEFLRPAGKDSRRSDLFAVDRADAFEDPDNTTK